MSRIFVNKSFPFLGFYTQKPTDPRFDVGGNVVTPAIEGRKYRFSGGIFDVDDYANAYGVDDAEKELLLKELARLEADPKSGVVAEEVAYEERFLCDFCKKPHGSKAAQYAHQRVHKSAAQIVDESKQEAANFRAVDIPAEALGRP